jgi:hypothetical protein
MDVTNALLNADCHEVWTEAGPKFGPEWEGKALIVRKALCELRSSGFAWRQLLSDASQRELHFRPLVADPDVCVRSAAKEDGSEHCKLVLVHVDDILCISADTKPVVDHLRGHLS